MILAPRGHEIDVVSQLLTWHDSSAVQAKNPPRQPAAVGMIGGDESKERDDHDQERVHGISACKVRERWNVPKQSPHHINNDAVRSALSRGSSLNGNTLSTEAVPRMWLGPAGAPRAGVLSTRGASRPHFTLHAAHSTTERQLL